MSSKTDLGDILANMQPELHDESYVFVTLPPGTPIPAGIEPLGTFREKEGLTLIVEKEVANQAKLAASKPMRAITLNVHSSLEAVGLTAAIASALTVHGISANVVAAYYHDHVFVGAKDGERAREILENLARRSR
ncbi:ACT domain-containing protein [Rhizobium alvei]|uniref:ACT domain-containing protein n=1 Tax=Rhizobium alvei TaxID=1132659 RepID=A0ABT8YP67_9HYPH|nr:ACT domain-containing protein [Rhizobium alvei]MDO6965168.1 ACT domain-containing protein [Rhizobium alvei]